jgi:hypothetical protein
MPLSKLVFKPGINREGTNYSNEGGWHDGDKIRFRYGYVEKMGGWDKVNPTAFEGTSRYLHDFVTLNSESLLFVGTEKKAYLEESGSLYDITPYRRTVWLPFAVSGSEGVAQLGTVTVQIGLPFEEGIVELQNGLSASGEVGILESVTTAQRFESDTFMTGGVGTVAVFDDDNRDATVEAVSYRLEDSRSITDYTKALNGSVGTVTVVIS